MKVIHQGDSNQIECDGKEHYLRMYGHKLPEVSWKCTCKKEDKE